MQSSRPQLLPFDAAGVPAALRAEKRWAPWRAVWNEKRQKYEKRPCRVEDTSRLLSTAFPDQWGTFEAAHAAHIASGGLTAGLGYCMTGPHGIVGVDLDRCVTDGVVEPRALEIVERLGGYAEFSPSGTGLRIFVRGDIGQDFTNHEAGVEVYGGHGPRFLTVSGQHLTGGSYAR